MKKVSLRTMATRDVQAVSSLAEKAFDYPWSIEMFEEGLRSGNEGWLLLDVETQQLIGWAIMKQVLDEAQLLNFCVDPDYQGKGYGRYLLHAVLGQVAHATAVHLDVRASNEKALALYQSAGFKMVGRRPDYYRTSQGREDALLLTLPLTQACEQYA